MEEGSVLFYKTGIGYRQGIVTSLRVPLFSISCKLLCTSPETDFFLSNCLWWSVPGSLPLVHQWDNHGGC